MDLLDSFCLRASHDASDGLHVVVQARDVQHGYAQSQRRLPVRRVERAWFRRMAIESHPDVEGSFNVRHRSLYVEHAPVRDEGMRTQMVSEGKP